MPFATLRYHKTSHSGILRLRPPWLLSPKKNGPRYERLGGSGELIFSVIPAAVFEPLAAHCVIG